MSENNKDKPTNQNSDLARLKQTVDIQRKEIEKLRKKVENLQQELENERYHKIEVEVRKNIRKLKQNVETSLESERWKNKSINEVFKSKLLELIEISLPLLVKLTKDDSKLISQFAQEVIDQGKKDWEGKDFVNYFLWGSSLCKARLQEAYFSGANLKGANLSGANLQGANLCKASLEEANLQRANLKKKQISKKPIFLKAISKKLFSMGLT